MQLTSKTDFLHPIVNRKCERHTTGRKVAVTFAMKCRHNFSRAYERFHDVSFKTNEQKLLCCFRVLKTSLRQDGSVSIRRFWLRLHLFHAVWSKEHSTKDGTSFWNQDTFLVISESSVKAKTWWQSASSCLHFCCNEVILLWT